MVFFEPKRIYNGPFDGHHDRPVKPWSKHELSEVPDGHYSVPLGKAKVVREGEALTVLTYGTMVHVALAAVEENGIDAEVIDLRLVPLDIEAIEEREKDRPLPGGPGSDQDQRLRRRAGDPGAGALLLSPGAGRARNRCGTRPIRTPMNGSISRARSA